MEIKLSVKLFLVRHGKTKWNSEGRYQGSSNTGLTREGILQAKLAAKYLSKVNFSNIYSSPIAELLKLLRFLRRF